MLKLSGGLQVLGNPGLRVFNPAPVTQTPITWVIRTDWPNVDAAPMTDPHVCEEGGTLTMVQVSGSQSVSPAGQHNWSSGVAGNTGFRTTNTVPRTAGYTMILRGWQASATTGAVRPTVWKEDANIGVNVGDGNRWGLSLGNGNAFAVSDSTSATFAISDSSTLAINTSYHWINILRGTGAIYAIKGGTYTGWHVFWVTPSTLSANLYGIEHCGNKDGFETRWGIADMVTSGYTDFNGDYGLAATYNAAPAQGNTFTHDGNSTHYFTISTLPTNTGDAISYRFRLQDSSNYWRVTFTKDAGATCTISLDEVVAGVPTQRGSSASTIAAGDFIGILPYDQTIRVVEGTANGTFTTRITYSTAVNFEDETDGDWQTIPAGAAVSNHFIMPEYFSGTTATALDRLV